MDNYEFKVKYIPWNDYGFYTHYNLMFRRDDMNYIDIGRVLIIDTKKAREEEESEESYRNNLDQTFESLPETYISVGLNKIYYKNINKLSKDYPGLKQAIRHQLNDIVSNNTSELYRNDGFYQLSFTRHSTHYMIKNVFPRLLETGNEKKHYKLSLSYPWANGTLEINTELEEILSNNVYALIGNNGAGKTKLLNDTVRKLHSKDFDWEDDEQNINKILYLTISIFDNHAMRLEDVIEEVEYIGITDIKKANKLKNDEDLLKEIYKYFEKIVTDQIKESDFTEYIKNYSEDFYQYIINTFMEMYEDVIELAKQDIKKGIQEQTFYENHKDSFVEFSSGQKNMFFMIVTLLAMVEEDMFAVIDEPELYLHPPYIMTYINFLNYLFDRRNAIALIATHSPIIIQQIPTECVYRIARDSVSEYTELSKIDFPCYGENISLITDRIFNISRRQSGFYKDILNLNQEQLLEVLEYSKIGLEAKLVIKKELKKREQGDIDF